MMKGKLRSLCEEKTALTHDDILILETYESTLQSTADLIGGDAFIDCLDRSGRAFVAAQASPRYAASIYSAAIEGMSALPENEPAVYRAFEEGVPFRDTVANTQENKTVSQDVVPIRNAADGIIGLLICERDISREVNMERKFREIEALSRWGEGPSKMDCSADCRWIREAHHRIKNSLQAVSSVCNIKAREKKIPEVSKAYLECAGMTMAVAKLNEMLCGTSKPDTGDLQISDAISTLVNSIAPIIPQNITLRADTAKSSGAMGSGKIYSLMMVVTELIFNALQHAFGPEGGAISISVERGNRHTTVIVSDDGRGMSGSGTGSYGLTIVRGLIRDNLGGEMDITSSDRGTKVSLHFAS